MPRHPNPSTDLKIARLLNEAGGDFVSGEYLAESIGVSRVTVLNRVRALRERGFGIEGRHRLGYALRKIPLQLDPTAVFLFSATRFEDCTFQFLPTATSTNSEVEAHLDGNCGLPVVVFARRQTEGRGRRGRVWMSRSTDNLYVSFGFKPHIRIGGMGCFTLWMGLCTALAAETFIDRPIGLKWPNDLMMEDGGKLAGVLTEAKVDSEYLRHLVVGIGLNVNTTPSVLARVKDRKAVSLRSIGGKRLNLNVVAAGLMDAVLTGYEQFISGHYRDIFKQAWPSRDCLRDRRVAVDFHGSVVKGVAEGIGHEGELLVRTDDGTLRGITAGDATLLKSGS